jgi:RNA-dependent RNA polymerase
MSIINVSISTNYDREHALVFYLNAPPSYEQQEQFGGKRRKSRYLPIPGHERVAHFTSKAIRIVCSSQSDIQQFRNLSCNARINKVDEYNYPLEHRNLFSEADMIAIIHSLRDLPWKVAFQMEALLRAIDFKEVVTLYPVVQQMVQEKGTELVAKAIGEFRHQTDLLFYSEDDDTAKLVELFMQNVDALDKEDIVTAPCLADARSLYDAFHVDIMPMMMYLDGPFTEQSNCVIRAHDAHQDCFLHVSFVDEARLQYRIDHKIDGCELIKTRVGPLLYDGLKVVAACRFGLLAYLQSALKEHAVW